MSLVRRIATVWSSVVVRYASSGSKTWAEGLAYEIEFIENDWTALVWAFGSTRVLLDRREAIPCSPGEAAIKARQFAKKHDLQKDNAVHLFMFLQAFLCTLRLVFTRTMEQRIACVVVILTATYLGFFLLRFRRELQLSPQEDDARSWIVYYRNELERICRPRIFAVLLVTLNLYIAGTLFAQDKGIRENLIFSTFVGMIFAGITLLCIWKRWQFQRQIAALNEALQQLP